MQVGTSFHRWTAACWSWLHHCTPSKEAIDLLPFMLPCTECSAHMLRFRQEHPPYEPLSRWLVDLHNDINRRTGKSGVSYADSERIHAAIDGRMVFIQFLFASVFTLSTMPPSLCRAFCVAAFPTVGVQPPPSGWLDAATTAHMLPQILYEHVRPYGYTSFSALVVEFVPPHVYRQYGTIADGGTRLQAPCGGDIVSYAVASIVTEEEDDEDEEGDKLYRRVSDRLHRGALTNRILYFCPSSSPRSPPQLSALPPGEGTNVTEYIVGQLQPTGRPRLLLATGVVSLGVLLVVCLLYCYYRSRQKTGSVHV